MCKGLRQVSKVKYILVKNLGINSHIQVYQRLEEQHIM